MKKLMFLCILLGMLCFSCSKLVNESNVDKDTKDMIKIFMTVVVNSQILWSNVLDVKEVSPVIEQ